MWKQEHVAAHTLLEFQKKPRQFHPYEDHLNALYLLFMAKGTPTNAMALFVMPDGSSQFIEGWLLRTQKKVLFTNGVVRDMSELPGLLTRKTARHKFKPLL